MVELRGCVVWLCCVVVLRGCVVWFCRVVLLRGSVVRFCCVVVLRGCSCTGVVYPLSHQRVVVAITDDESDGDASSTHGGDRLIVVTAQQRTLVEL